jgi:hypothetical protein
MTETSRKRQLAAAYSRVHSDLCEIFYNVDPDAMGVSIAAPDDEYSTVVTKLLVDLRDERNKEGVARVVREMYPFASTELVDQVFDAWKTFIVATSLETQS